MGANEFVGPSDFDFCCFLVENSDKSGIDFHICSIFSLESILQKEKLPKSVGASTHNFEKHGC